MSCLCCSWKIPHSKNWQEAESHWWAWEHNKAVHIPRQVSLSSPKNPETQEKCLAILICFFLTSIAYYSQIAKKDIYLNSGLTSTKNYGKTILTKVGEYSLQSVNIQCTYMCVGDVCHGIVTSFHALSETSCWLSDWVTSLSPGIQVYKTKIIVFCPCWQGELGLNGIEDWIPWGTVMRKRSQCLIGAVVVQIQTGFWCSKMNLNVFCF